MSELLVEFGLRLAKLVLATLIAVPIYVGMVWWAGATPGPELGLLSWIAGGVALALLETSAF